MRPVSNTTRVHGGADVNAAAMASGDDRAVTSFITAPSRSRTQMCVFSNDTSRPAK